MTPDLAREHRTTALAGDDAHPFPHELGPPQTSSHSAAHAPTATGATHAAQR